jgi:hypothetical protein
LDCKKMQLGATLNLLSAIWHNMVSLSPFPLTFYSSNLFSYAEVNSRNIIISEGALSELFRISRDCSREAIRMLAHQTLTSSPTLQAEMRRLGIKM